MLPFKKKYKGGAPWIDYKEAVKGAFQLVFIFQLKNFISYVLGDICITYPCGALGAAQPIMRVTAHLSSTTQKLIPVELPENLFSSPSQNYRLGVLNEDAQGMRLQPVYFQYPCDYGDNIKINITGVGVGMLIGCKISGQQYEKRGYVTQ